MSAGVLGKAPKNRGVCKMNTRGGRRKSKGKRAPEGKERNIQEYSRGLLKGGDRRLENFGQKPVKCKAHREKIIKGTEKGSS